MPVNPLNAETVMVEVAEVPTVTGVGDVAAIVKSGDAVMVKVAVALWVSDPLVPVIVTLRVLGEVEEQIRVAVPEPITLLGVIDPQLRPLGTVSVRLTVPLKPLSAVTVIVETSELPTVPDGDVAAMLKSVTAKVEVAVCVRLPLVPVIVST